MQKAGRGREWCSQYQQTPTPEDGTYCQRSWFDNRYVEIPKPVNVYMSSDFAVTDAAEGRDPDYTVHGVFGIAGDGKIYVLDWWKGRTSPDVWIEVLLDMVQRWKPIFWCSGKGVIRRAVEKIITARCNELKVWFKIIWVDETVDKSAKGRAFQARASMGNIRFPKNEAWADDAIETIVGFPTLKHDDDFDVCANMCLALDNVSVPRVQNIDKKIVRDKWKDMNSRSTINRWK